MNREGGRDQSQMSSAYTEHSPFGNGHDLKTIDRIMRVNNFNQDLDARIAL